MSSLSSKTRPAADQTADAATPRPPLLMIGNFLSRYGLSRCACEELQLRLRKRGWSVRSASTSRARLPRLFDMWSTALRQGGSCAVAYVDLFSGPSFFWAELVAWQLRRTRTPYVLALRGGALPEFCSSWPKRARRLLQSAAAVVAPSTFLQSALSPYRRDILVIPNALDTTLCRFVPRARLLPKLVWLRAFHRIYAPQDAIWALALLKQTHPNATLLMVGGDKGDGSFQAAQQLCSRLAVEDSVQFAGAVPKSEVAEYLSRGDIFLNTSTVDNTPVSVLEAMACGLCVVSSDPGGIRHLLRNGDTALLVPPSRPGLIAEAVLRLLADPVLAATLSYQSRQFAARCDWEFVLPQWEHVFAATVPRSPRFHSNE